MQVAVAQRLAVRAVVVALAVSAHNAEGDPPGWTLAWSDDFNQLDTDRWEVVRSYSPTNESVHAYLPSQVSAVDGKLVLTSDDTATTDLLGYRSGQVITKESQKHGRWEVRAKLPGTVGTWPAIWLLPDTDDFRWPSGGEIDIMENRGNQPTLTSSAFHYGTNPPYKHNFVFQEQSTRVGGALVNYHEGFHTYAVDWTEKYLRFFVDDVHFYTVHDEDVGGFLSSSVQPMQLVINTAIGGHFLPNPDASSVWPQQFLVDSVRVYTADDATRSRELQNGGFEQESGTLAGWSVFGNHLLDNPNVSASGEAASTGDTSLKLFGSFTRGDTYSGVAQDVVVEPGQQVRLSLETFINPEDSLAGTDNTLSMKLEFYDEFGAKFGSDSMLHVEESQIVDNAAPTGDWQQHELLAVVPAGATAARMAIVFHQPGNGAGAVYVDDVSLVVTDPGASIGDFNSDGIVSLADYSVWRDNLGQGGSGLAADADASGQVDELDYGLWKQNFGHTVPSSLAYAVPETSPRLVTATCAAAWFLIRFFAY